MVFLQAMGSDILKLAIFKIVCYRGYTAKAFLWTMAVLLSANTSRNVIDGFVESKNIERNES